MLSFGVSGVERSSGERSGEFPGATGFGISILSSVWLSSAKRDVHQPGPAASAAFVGAGDLTMDVTGIR